MKGLSPVIASVLLLVITVVSGVTIWFWIATYSSSPALADTTPKSYLVVNTYTNFSNNGCESLDIKNSGGTLINNLILEVRDYKTGKLAGVNGTDPNNTAYVNISSELLPGMTYNFNISMLGNASSRTSVPFGTYTLRVSSLSSSLTGVTDRIFTCISGAGVRSGITKIYLQFNINETFGNTLYCSPNTYVLENDKTKFFISTPDITNATNCSLQLPANYNYYALSPMRIWSSDASTTYRVNDVILGETYFRMVDTAAHALYANSIDQFNVTTDRIIITPTLIPESALFDVKVTYLLLPDRSDYVKVTFWVRNKNDTARSVGFTWWGDQDPPSGTWYNETYGNCGVCTGNTCTGGLNARKWVAFARCGGNDVYGIVVTPEDTLSLNTYSGPTWVSNVVALNPGQEYEFAIYFVSGLKGSAEQEWKPVEDLYRHLFGS